VRRFENPPIHHENSRRAVPNVALKIKPGLMAKEKTRDAKVGNGALKDQRLIHMSPGK
jgi:hypothetical protein